MKVLETHYHNHYFRSRTEARWAVFLDSLDVKWNYETEAFDLDDGDFYLPDFWLPDLNTFLEIKGKPPTHKEIVKCRKLQFFTGFDVAIFHGLPMENEGTLFGQSSENGGMLTESPVQWMIEDNIIGFTYYPDDVPHANLSIAAIRARKARFEFEGARKLLNTVNYDQIAF